jgi:hypothetical protein
MNSTLEYLAEKHQTLKDDYKTPDKRNGESCSIIAVNVAKRLVAEGKTPCIMVVRGEIIDGSGNRKTITPKIYKGRVEWGMHQVCCSEGFAYDPILGQSVLVEDYCQKAFEDKAELDILIGQNEIKEFINE